MHGVVAFQEQSSSQAQLKKHIPPAVQYGYLHCSLYDHLYDQRWEKKIQISNVFGSGSLLGSDCTERNVTVHK